MSNDTKPLSVAELEEMRAYFADRSNPDVDRLLATVRDLARDNTHLRGACNDLTDALAKRCLADKNDELTDPNEWPCGQDWDDLVGSSKSIFRRVAWEEADLFSDAMRRLLSPSGMHSE